MGAAVAPGVSREKREFYGFCALAFGDVDVNKDGFINLEEFDRLLESVAAVPRRYGLAPVSTVSTLERQMAHKKLFDQLDTKAGPARGVLGLDQFVEWAFDHVISKIGKVPAKDVGLYQVQDYTEEEYIGFVERAVNNPGSYEHASFYNFILNCLLRLMNSVRDASPMISLTNSSLVPPLSHVTLALLRQSPAQRPARRCLINSRWCVVT